MSQRNVKTSDNIAFSIKATTNNKIVDASPSLLGYARKLPEYTCKTISVEKSAKKHQRCD